MTQQSYDNIEISPLGPRRYIGYAAGLIFTITPSPIPRSAIRHTQGWKATGPGRTILSDSLPNLSLCLLALECEREGAARVIDEA